MKKLDWKSFSIGVLLTTTVVLSTAAGAANGSSDWSNQMKWITKVTDVGEGINMHFDVNPGFEPFQAVVVGGEPRIVWRKRAR